MPSAIAFAAFANDPGSLTKKLRAAASKDFTVKVLFEGFVFRANVPSLQIKQKQLLWCRQVSLCVDYDVWVEAETLIPLTSLRGKGRQLLYLKDRSLGEILFTDPFLKRSDFLFKGHTRSSVFNFHHHPLLVSETFLPKAIAYFSQG